jgi:hypothetical protein
MKNKLILWSLCWAWNCTLSAEWIPTKVQKWVVFALMTQVQGQSRFGIINNGNTNPAVKNGDFAGGTTKGLGSNDDLKNLTLKSTLKTNNNQIESISADTRTNCKINFRQESMEIVTTIGQCQKIAAKKNRNIKNVFYSSKTNQCQVDNINLITNSNSCNLLKKFMCKDLNDPQCFLISSVKCNNQDCFQWSLEPSSKTRNLQTGTDVIPTFEAGKADSSQFIHNICTIVVNGSKAEDPKKNFIKCSIVKAADCALDVLKKQTISTANGFVEKTNAEIAQLKETDCLKSAQIPDFLNACYVETNNGKVYKDCSVSSKDLCTKTMATTNLVSLYGEEPSNRDCFKSFFDTTSSICYQQLPNGSVYTNCYANDENSCKAFFSEEFFIAENKNANKVLDKSFVDSIPTYLTQRACTMKPVKYRWVNDICYLTTDSGNMFANCLDSNQQDTYTESNCKKKVTESETTPVIINKNIFKVTNFKETHCLKTSVEFTSTEAGTLVNGEIDLVNKRILLITTNGKKFLKCNLDDYIIIGNEVASFNLIKDETLYNKNFWDDVYPVENEEYLCPKKITKVEYKNNICYVVDNNDVWYSICEYKQSQCNSKLLNGIPFDDIKKLKSINQQLPNYKDCLQSTSYGKFASQDGSLKAQCCVITNNGQRMMLSSEDKDILKTQKECGSLKELNVNLNDLDTHIVQINGCRRALYTDSSIKKVVAVGSIVVGSLISLFI